MRKLLIATALFMTANVFAQTAPATQATEKYFNSIKNSPTKLQTFINNMPKGGDLHIHVSGATYAENLIKYGMKDNYCINPDFSATITKNCPPTQKLAYINAHPKLSRALIDAWSMQNYNYRQHTGHDHFFTSFGKFLSVADAHSGEELAEIVARAASEHELYLELMVTPDLATSAAVGKKLGWNPDLASFRTALLSSGLEKYIRQTSITTDLDEKKMRKLLNCKADPTSAACTLQVRFLYQVLREQEPAEVFSQLLTGFEVASRDKRFVGINIVQPEDGKISVRDYDLQMQMIGFLHQQYPNVKISLHAGEMPFAMTNGGINNHIRNAIEIGHANRIGHGTDIAHEKDYPQILNMMREQGIAVEINLTSNDEILGVKGEAHPFPLYLKYKVPTVINTDDEGVLRTNMNKEYYRAAHTYNLSYLVLKNIDRNSITYSFLPGKSLWLDNSYQAKVPACQHDMPGKANVSAACEDFLQSSQKAMVQWKLEKDFNAFEKKI